MQRIATTHPDKTFTPDDPAAPKFKGKAFTNTYKIEAEKALAFDTEDGGHGLLVTQAGMATLPDYAQFWTVERFGTHRVFLGDDIAVPLYEHPDWKQTYEHKTGRQVPEKIPYWYEEGLIAVGRKPFRSPRDVAIAMQRHGWKELKDDHKKDLVAKQFHGIWIHLYSYGHFGVNMYMTGSNIPRGLEQDQWAAFHEDTRDEIEDVRKVSIEDIERKAAQVSIKIKAWKPARKPVDRSNVELTTRGEVLKGVEALDTWKAKVEKILLEDIFDTRYPPKNGFLTRSIILNVMENYGMKDQIYGISEAKLALIIRGILDKLAKAGKIEMDNNEKNKPKWWPKTSTARVAHRYLMGSRFDDQQAMFVRVVEDPQGYFPHPVDIEAIRQGGDYTFAIPGKEPIFVELDTHPKSPADLVLVMFGVGGVGKNKWEFPESEGRFPSKEHFLAYLIYERAKKAPNKPVAKPVAAPVVPQRTFEDWVGDVKSFLHTLNYGVGGRAVRVDFEGGQYPAFFVEPSYRQRLDHYGNDGEGWDDEKWEDDYAGPVRKKVQTAVDARFGKGVLDVEIGDKGHVDISFDRKKLKLGALAPTINPKTVKIEKMYASAVDEWATFHVEVTGPWGQPKNDVEEKQVAETIFVAAMHSPDWSRFLSHVSRTVETIDEYANDNDGYDEEEQDREPATQTTSVPIPRSFRDIENWTVSKGHATFSMSNRN